MSMVDDNSPRNFGDVESDDPLDALEQAQFDAMRTGGKVPETIPDTPAAPDPAAKVPVVDPAAAPAEPDDPDVETVKDATGKEVIDTATGKPQKRVSFHKFQRTEKARKDAEDALTAEREKNARIDERLKIINEALATPEPGQQRTQEEEDPEPDPETQIFEHNKWLRRQLSKTNERLNNFEQTTTTQQEEVQLATTYQQQAASFAANEPTFAQAYVYLINQRDGELEEAGVKDKKLRDQQIVREEKGLVRGALAQGRNPAELLFAMAKRRGFVATAPAPAPATKDPGALDAPVAAKPAAAAAGEPAKPAVKDVIDNILRGQAASASLSNAGGSAPEQLTREMLADMSQEEFDDLTARLPKAKLRELLGG